MRNCRLINNIEDGGLKVLVKLSSFLDIFPIYFSTVSLTSSILKFNIAVVHIRRSFRSHCKAIPTLSASAHTQQQKTNQKHTSTSGNQSNHYISITAPISRHTHTIPISTLPGIWNSLNFPLVSGPITLSDVRPECGHSG